MWVDTGISLMLLLLGCSLMAGGGTAIVVAYALSVQEIVASLSPVVFRHQGSEQGLASPRILLKV